MAFEQVFLGEPLSDPSIPSLVFEGSDGEILGFIGSLVHRMRFEQRSVRLACSSSLVVSPRARKLGAGGLLLRKYLTGPQDLTMTDTAGRATEQMWKRLGGSQYHLGSVTWLHLIRPLQAAVGLKLWHLGRHQRLPLVRPLCRPVDAAYSRSANTDGTGDVEKLTEEQLSPQLLIDHHRLGPQQFRLWPRLRRRVARPAFRPDRPVSVQRPARQELRSRRPREAVGMVYRLSATERHLSRPGSRGNTRQRGAAVPPCAAQGEGS